MSALRTELTTDPLGLGYVALLPDSPGRIVDLLVAQTRTFVQSTFVTARGILAEITDGAVVLDALEAASAANSNIKWAMIFLQKDSGIDVGHPRTIALLDLIAAAGVLTTAQAEEIKTLAVQPGSRAQELGLGDITIYDVLAATQEA